MSREGECGAHYEQHPTRPELVAVCTKPLHHDGACDNVLTVPRGVNA